jgi:hypothetical protein
VRTSPTLARVRLLACAAAASVALALLVLGTGTASAASASSTLQAGNAGGCQAYIETPHFSDGAGGVIAKGHWKCKLVPTAIELPFNFNLWLCTDKKPEASEKYLDDDSYCYIPGQVTEGFTLTKANTYNTVYVPPGKGTGAHGSGWWISCAIWYSVHDGSTGATLTTFSNSWEGSG